MSASAWFVVGAAVTAAVVGFVARSADARDPSAPAIPADAERVGFAVRDTRSGVAILDATRPFRLELGNGPLVGSPPEPGARERAAAIVARELARYTPTLVRATKLRGVVLTAHLVEGTKTIPSLPNVAGLLILDVVAEERDLVRTFHHEMFHFYDLADDGKLAPDAEWAALNAEGFTYGAGGRSLRGAWAAKRPEGLDGFVSAYATSGVEEDKAETFAFAVARPEDVAALAHTDAVLAKKLAAIDRRMAAADPEAPRSLGLQRSTPPR